MKVFGTGQRLLGQLALLVRWTAWGKAKLPVYLVAMCYAVLQFTSPGFHELVDMGILLAILSLYAAFGHMVNDYSDREPDRIAGKLRPLARWRAGSAAAVMLLTSVASVMLTFVRFDVVAAALVALACLVALFYSLPPVRLKERGVSGWTAAAVAQQTLPMAIVFQAFDAWDLPALTMSLTSTFTGMRYIIVHQIVDHAGDLKAGVRTMATAGDPLRLTRFLGSVIFPLEVTCLCATVVVMANDYPAVVVLAAGNALAFLYFVLNGQQLLVALPKVLLWFYCFYWPLAFGLILALRNAVFLVVPMLIVALQQQRISDYMRARAKTRNSQPERMSVQFTKSNPYPYYAEARARRPVWQSRFPALGPTWMVSRYSDALVVFKDPRFVKNASSVGSGQEKRQVRKKPVRGFGPDMLELDPPDHTRLRNLVSKAFTSRPLERFSDRIRELASGIIDRAMLRGEMELISEFAAIPITIITELMGVPIGNIDRFRAFTYQLTLGRATGKGAPVLTTEKERFSRHLKSVFESRRTEPRDDLVSALVQAEQDGDRLSTEELMGMAYFLLLAGFVTTVNLIGNGTFALLRHPDQLDLFRNHPDITEGAIEELLRFDSPLEMSSVHFAATDVELSGVRIPRGARVRVLIPSVNHDETQFPDAEILDVTRDARRHLAFAQGIHYCLGAPLARLEGRIVLRTLVEKVPGLRLAVPPEQVEWLQHPVLRGLRRLPVRC